MQNGLRGEQRSAEKKNRKLAESTLQRDKERNNDDDIAGIDTMAHADHADVLGVGVVA
jgi:hypothetical protein